MDVDLVGIRARIDTIDEALVRLLDERVALSVAAQSAKEPSRDPAREEAVLARVEALATERLDPRFLRTLFRTIIDECCRVHEDGTVQPSARSGR